jgi:hypothetical protein
MAPSAMGSAIPVQNVSVLTPSEPMLRKKQRQSDDYNDAEFLGFAKSYLSEAFPNPQRIGCPPDSDLQRMAEHPVEARDAAASEHLTSCSPCFNRYMEILTGLRESTR